ncbi:bifunctional ADP-dependent NAD(P)H-hydrate dehydratase/NAD(P)H-hydrate epimerase [Marinobacter fuscus]|uniref:Bifunctional NAD(P)H-hydrate repair enzyme n=1 Tax=Marinobacter fuscus TaxID=2109942 RepID=A0A2T1K7I9_9GAMM|nr:NAD(P)H-hydrate dehydratase [Marinobacter fuscus]PSF06030.1 bifunctional ADP-dependent NAD(P)H-hydrate dehydratase/NAD(P)H-hydrate epimerase [Marinobacter fuscus]
MSIVSTNSLTEPLYSADSVRAMDRYLIDRKGVDGFELMQSAASAAFRQLMSVWPGQPSLLVFCGAGNNGGDGYLIAASARRHGLKAVCVAVAPAEKLAGDALLAYNKACADGVTLLDLRQLSEDETEQLAAGADVLVDAMLGTGFAGSPREPFASAIRLLNRSGKPVLAVDVPSGLDATTGAAIGEVVRADITVTFIGAKLGLYTGAGAGVCGRVIFEPLVDTATAQASGEQALAELCRWQQYRSRLPRRAPDAHKGDFGHVLVVAGDHGFGGAGILAAEAASRAGAGLVSLATRPEYVTAALARCPSVMVRGVTHGSELPALLLKADVVVCGPGLGQSSWGHQMLQQVVESGKPRVLDADALNIMAGRAPAPSRHHVLTPHPGEAARLLGCTVQEVEANRLAAATSLQKQWRGIVLLKGAGTVIAAESSLPRIIPGGNPGMATGGMGDVLSGILGALLAQVTVPESAVTLAASLHLAAANAAVKTQGYMGLLPTDVITCLPEALRLAEADVNSENRENG